MLTRGPFKFTSIASTLEVVSDLFAGNDNNYPTPVARRRVSTGLYVIMVLFLLFFLRKTFCSLPIPLAGCVKFCDKFDF